MTEDARTRLAAALDGLDAVQMAKDAHRGFMARALRDPTALDAFRDLAWSIAALPADANLITSDRPLLVNLGGQGTPLQLLTMPISPTKLFLAYPPSWSADDPDFQNLVNTLVLRHDLLLLKGPCRCVYSKRKLEDGQGVRLRSAVEQVLSGGK